MNRMKSTGVRAGWAGMVALAALSMVAGCGNDRNTAEGRQAIAMAFQQVRAKLAPGKGNGAKPAAPDPEKLALSAMKTVKGSILIAQIESSGTVSALGEIGSNRGLRTYATPNEQSLTLKDGILVATRGLGNDLMSSDADAAIRLIRSRSAGSAKRTYRYLDGESIERPLPMDCVTATAAPQEIVFAGSRHSTLSVGEACTYGTLKVTNAYWVTGDGTVVLSRQWIGPGLGYVTIQLVRR